MGNKQFEFESDRAFVIWRNSVVFVGHVKSGGATIGDTVQFRMRGEVVSGVITKIRTDGSFAEETTPGEEQCLCLRDFSDTRIDRALDDPPETDYPLIENMGLEFPLVISIDE